MPYAILAAHTYKPKAKKIRFFKKACRPFVPRELGIGFFEHRHQKILHRLLAATGTDR
jgi:hypothetical protein